MKVDRSIAATHKGNGCHRSQAPGLHAIGGVAGLCLSITKTGARSWILRSQIGGKRRSMGLGSYPSVTLSAAKEKARAAREKIDAGEDPIESRRLARIDLITKQRVGLTFTDAFDRIFAERKVGELKNKKHADQWSSTIKEYAIPTIGQINVAEITVSHLLQILQPIWKSKTETATRVRGRIEAVLDWATASGHRTGVNPAQWKGNLQQLLPAPGKLKSVTAQPALPLGLASTWFAALKLADGLAATALEFLVLTAARSGEVRGATWNEIELGQKIWTVPAGRMKGGRIYRVPLTNQAIAILDCAPRFPGTNFVFPSARGKKMSDMTLSAVMRRMQEVEINDGRIGYVDGVTGRPAVPHGLRSTFRDWVSEHTIYPREMAEVALAHNIGTEVERAYSRSDMLEKRRKMMIEWAEFLTSEAARSTQI